MADAGSSKLLNDPRVCKANPFVIAANDVLWYIIEKR